VRFENKKRLCEFLISKNQEKCESNLMSFFEGYLNTNGCGEPLMIDVMAKRVSTTKR
jgi:hypothetical protein